MSSARDSWYLCRVPCVPQISCLKQAWVQTKEELDMLQTSRTSRSSCAGTGTSSAVSMVSTSSTEFGHPKSVQIPQKCANSKSAQTHHKTRKQAFEQKKSAQTKIQVGSDVHAGYDLFSPMAIWQCRFVTEGPLIGGG